MQFRLIKRGANPVSYTHLDVYKRQALAYALSAVPALGVTGIWMSVPIGWALADAVGVLYYYRNRTSILAGG